MNSRVPSARELGISIPGTCQQTRSMRVSSTGYAEGGLGEDGTYRLSFWGGLPGCQALPSVGSPGPRHYRFSGAWQDQGQSASRLGMNLSQTKCHRKKSSFRPDGLAGIPSPARGGR